MTLVDNLVDNSTRHVDEPSLEPLSDYERRKLAQQCTYPGCSERPVDGFSQCAGHRDNELQRKRDYIARKRDEWKRGKRCSWCGRVRRDGSNWGCEKHDPELVDNVVDKSKSSRIAAATTVRTLPSDAGRTRYHGQNKRGPMSREAMNRQDLEAAAKEVAASLTENAYAYSAEVEALPKIQRMGERQRLAGRIYFAIRLLGSVAVREGVDLGDLVESLRDGED